MQRSLCDFPTEIWYYYTFYNSCDDEQREYRCERRTKQVERIQAKPGNDHERYRMSNQSSSINHSTLIGNLSTDAKIIVAATIVDIKTHTAHVMPLYGLKVMTMQGLLQDQRSSQYIDTISQRLVKRTRKVFWKSSNRNIFRDIMMYYSCQYERILHILISPNVATGMLLSNFALLWLIRTIHDKDSM